MTWPWQPNIRLRAIKDPSADRLVLDEDARDIAQRNAILAERNGADFEGPDKLWRKRQK